MNLEIFKKVLLKNQVEWRQHVLIRMMERGILQNEVLSVLSHCHVIEDYRDDKPYPSALFYGIINKKPLHVVAALCESDSTIYIITVYEPDLKHFKHGFKERIKA